MDKGQRKRNKKNKNRKPAASATPAAAEESKQEQQVAEMITTEEDEFREVPVEVEAVQAAAESEEYNPFDEVDVLRAPAEAVGEAAGEGVAVEQNDTNIEGAQDGYGGEGTAQGYYQEQQQYYEQPYDAQSYPSQDQQQHYYSDQHAYPDHDQNQNQNQQHQEHFSNLPADQDPTAAAQHSHLPSVQEEHPVDYVAGEPAQPVDQQNEQTGAAEEPLKETEKSRDVKIFDESQEMEPQITRKSTPTNPLKPQQDSQDAPRLQSQQSLETPDKVPRNYDGSSFNTSILNDMSMVSFNLGDPAAQLGLGEIGSSSFMMDEVNLMQIRETLQAREMKIKTLIGDKQKLKGLLVKAKSAIGKINDQYKAATEKVRVAESKLSHSELEKKALSKALEDFQKRRNGIDKSQVSQILARIKVGEIGYTLIQDVQHCCEWYRDNMIMEVQNQLSQEWNTVKQINYSTIFAEKQQLEESLTLCMNQYEERLRRANQYMEQSNDGYAQIKEELRMDKEKIQLEQRSRNEFLAELIKRSQQVKTKVHRVFEGKQRNQEWLRETQNDIEMGVAQIYDLKSDSDAMCAELRDHIMELYNRTVIGLLRKQQKLKEQLNEQETEWQATCNKLIEDQQLARQEQDKLEDKLEQTVAQFNALKSEHYKLVNENQDKDDQLTQERQNSVNSEYLKNILTSYFMTNDPKVQLNLIRVVFQAMKFDEDEQDRVLEAHSMNNQSMFSKAVGSFF